MKVIVAVFSAMIKHRGQKQLGEERFISAYTSVSKARQGLKQRPQKNPDHWPLLLLETAWVLPHQSLIKKMTPTDLPTGNLMEAFSQLTFLFLDDSDLCQVDKKIQPGQVPTLIVLFGKCRAKN